MVWGGSSVNKISHIGAPGAISSKRSAIRPYQLGPGESREPFACLFLCGECGYMHTQEARVCPACGRPAWIDLGYTAYAETLRASEAEDRRHPPEHLKWRIRRSSLATGGAIGLGGAAGLALSGLASLGAPLVLGLGAAAVGLTHALGRHRLGREIMLERIERPRRWYVPLPPPDPKARPASRLTGPLRPSGPLLRAPFTGRACAGYDVGVLFDAPGDAWPPVWVLREMHTCAYEVEGRPVPADSTTIELTLPPITAPSLGEAQLERFLRERGLFLADGQFDLFEAIVEPEQTYELVWPSAPTDAPPLLRATTARRAKNPYR
jgi:hypothetical protein